MIRVYNPKPNRRNAYKNTVPITIKTKCLLYTYVTCKWEYTLQDIATNINNYVSPISFLKEKNIFCLK